MPNGRKLGRITGGSCDEDGSCSSAVAPLVRSSAGLGPVWFLSASRKTDSQGRLAVAFFTCMRDDKESQTHFRFSRFI